jgi:hypothetical protein
MPAREQKVHAESVQLLQVGEIFRAAAKGHLKFGMREEELALGPGEGAEKILCCCLCVHDCNEPFEDLSAYRKEGKEKLTIENEHFVSKKNPSAWNATAPPSWTGEETPKCPPPTF